MATNEPQSCCVATIWQKEGADLEEEKTPFPGQMLENKGNHRALSGFTDVRLKDHSLVWLNPNFLIHHFAFDRPVLYSYN